MEFTASCCQYLYDTHTCCSKLCRVVSCVVLCFVGRIQFPSACHMNYDPYTVFSVEHTSSVTPGIKYVVVVVVVIIIIITITTTIIIIIIIIIICKPHSIKVVDFPAHNKQQLMHWLWLCKCAQILWMVIRCHNNPILLIRQLWSSNNNNNNDNNNG